MRRKFDSIALIIKRNKWGLLAVILVVNIYLAIHLPSLEIDNSLSVWFAKDDPALISYEAFRKQFGNDEVIITSLQFDAPIKDYREIRKLSLLSDKLINVQGVNRVMSILDVPVGFNGSLEPVSLREGLSRDTGIYPFEKLERLKELKTTRRFLVQDLSCLVFYTWLDTLPDIEQKRNEIHDEVFAHIEHSFGKDAEINQCGPGIIYDTLNRETLAVVPLMMALSYLIVLILVWFFTRRIRWVMITLFAVTFSNLSLFGLMALMGSKPNMVTMAIPPLIVVVGVANIIHYAKGIDHLKFKHISGESSRKLLSFILKPLLFNALTTAGGFASLSVARLQVTREYGIYAAAGVLLAFIHSLLFSILFSGKGIEDRKEAPWIHWFENKIVSLMMFSAQNRRLIYTLSALVLIFFSMGVLRLESDTNTKDFFQKNHPIQEQIDVMEKQLGYFYPADFLIRFNDSKDKARYWKDTAFLSRLEGLQKKIDEDPHFGTTYSVADLFRDSYTLFSGNYASDSAGIADIPDYYRREISRTIQKSEYFGQLVADDKTTVRMSVTGPIESAKTYTRLTAYFERTAQDIFGDGLEIEPAGNLPLYSQSIKYTMHDQLTSLSLAIVIILLLIGILLRSVRLSLLAIPSNLIPIVFILGFMGYFSVRLDLATVTIAAAILGIIVDDTIHLLYGYKKLRYSECSKTELIRHLAHQKGPALVFTSIILCSGFIVVGLAGLRSIARPGWLISLAIFVALITDLFLLPALLILGKKENRK